MTHPIRLISLNRRNVAGFDGKAFRAEITGRGATPVIPNKSN
jgi:hypothetical protein